MISQVGSMLFTFFAIASGVGITKNVLDWDGVYVAFYVLCMCCSITLALFFAGIITT
jgi:hypothetical protein